jgi:hypothetical protein
MVGVVVDQHSATPVAQAIVVMQSLMCVMPAPWTLGVVGVTLYRIYTYFHVFFSFSKNRSSVSCWYFACLAAESQKSIMFVTPDEYICILAPDEAVEKLEPLISVPVIVEPVLYVKGLDVAMFYCFLL